MKQEQITNRFHTKFISVLLVLGVFVYGLSTAAYAALSVIFFEDFSSPASLQNWQVVWNKQWANEKKSCIYRHGLANWTVTQGKVRIAIEGPPCVIDLAPISVDLRSLDNYSVEFKLTLSESIQMDRAVAFLWQNPSNWYDLKLFDNTVQVQKVVDGVVHQLPNSSTFFPFQPNREYQFKIEVTPQQRVRISIENQVILDITDQSPFIQPIEAQTITLRGGVGGVSRSVSVFDDVIISTNSTPTKSINLNVPLFKQTDQLWSTLEYNHAHSWSDNPTMGRWGCAVTSMAMILRHYGITQLPDGQIIDPQTLNTWLKNQADGYINGMVNWLAITRLTRLVSPKLNTPKLEFSRSDGTQAQVIEIAKKDIAAQKPVILNVPGHFFVADGVDSVANTLLIKEPAFEYQRLNQHRKEVTSVRRFQPSQTDLSYLMLVIPPDLSVEVKNTAGEIVPTQNINEFIADPFTEFETAAKSPILHQLLIEKPESGSYSFTIRQSQETSYKLKLYSYDVVGNVKVVDKEGVAGPNGNTFTINFQKEERTQTQPKISWQNFRRNLRHLIQQRQVTRSIISLYIEYLAMLATHSSAKQQLRYIGTIQKAVQLYKPFIKKDAYISLASQLESLKEQTNQDQN